MSKKNKKKSKNSVSNSVTSINSLIQSAESTFNNGDLKNALLRYERLYKEQPDEFTKQRLVECLLARGKQLLEKGLPVEVCALFARLQKLEVSSLPVLDYLTSLIDARYYDRAYQLIQEHQIEVSSIPKPAAAYLASTRLIETTSAVRSNTNNLFLQDISSVQLLFSLFDSKASTDQILSQLNTISLRSPFKDLRLVIQALLEFQKSSTNALKLVGEISKTSPFYSIAKVIQLACQPVMDLFQGMSDLTALQLNLLSCLMGWSDATLKLILEMVNVFVKQSNPTKQIKLLMKLPPVISNELIKSICFSLYDGQKTNWKLISDCFGHDAYPEARMNALQAEKRADPWDCIEYWDECIESIKKSKKLPQELIGLIRLHQYEIIDEDCSSDNDKCVEWLIDSLNYLPKHKNTYRNICNFYARNKKKKLFEKWQTKMEKEFPDDIEVLLKAADYALERKTYSKTVSLLKKALAIDSINTQAKQLLAYSYLQKSFFEISKGKYDDARIELEHSKKLRQYIEPPCLIPLSESLLAYQLGDFSLAQEQLNLAYQLEKNKVSVNYMLLHYIGDFSIPNPAVIQHLTWDNKDTSPFAALTYGLERIEYLLNIHVIKKILIIETKPGFKELFEASLKKPLELTDYDLLCHLLLRVKCYSSLALTAKKALKTYRNSPLFNYYLLQSTIKEDARVVTEVQYKALIEDLEQLRGSSEAWANKTGQMIAKLLDEVEDYQIPFDDFPFPSGTPKHILEELLDSLYD